MSTAAKEVCPRCNEGIEAHHVRTWMRADPFGKSDGWIVYHSNCHAEMVKSAEQKRTSDLEAALVALIDAIDAKDSAAIDRALLVGRGLTF